MATAHVHTDLPLVLAFHSCFLLAVRSILFVSVLQAKHLSSAVYPELPCSMQLRPTLTVIG